MGAADCRFVVLGIIEAHSTLYTGMPIPLAARLRDATRHLHAEVERAGIMQRLLRGAVSRAAYAALLRNLHALYVPLEDGLSRHAGHPGLAPVADVRLYRSRALADDLALLHGPCWADDIGLTPAARQYADHLRRLADAEPAALAAHAYVRYLGDLSGGQVLARVVATALGLAAGEGVGFYDFGSADDVGRLAQAFRAGLDGLAGDEAGAQALVDEACAAFERHRQLFEQVARVTPAAA